MSGGGKIAVSGISEIHTQIAASLDPQHARNMANMVSAKINAKFEKSGQTQTDIDIRNEELAKVDIAENFVNNTTYRNLKGKPRETVFQNVMTTEGNKVKIEELLADIQKGKKVTKYAPTYSAQEINQRESDIKILEDQNSKLHEKNIKEVYIQNYANNKNGLAQWMNDQKTGVFKDKTVTSFKTLKRARNYFKKLDPKDKKNEAYFKDGNLNSDIQAFLDGNDNAINFNNTDIYTIDERIRLNIKLGDQTSFNAIHHEVLHYMLAGISKRNLQKMRREIMSDLSNSKDAQLVAIADQIRSRKGYDNYKTKVGNEEFFTALSDTFAMAEARDLSLPANTTLTKMGSAFKGMFVEQTDQGMAGHFKALENGGEMLNFIKKYNKVNGKTPIFTANEVPSFGKSKQTVTKQSKALVGI